MNENIVETSVVEQEHKNSNPTAIENDNIVEVAEYAEKRIAAINKIKSIVFKVTNTNDWVDQGGKPYLQASGCHKLANIFGISWRFIGEPKRVFEEDGNYRYEVSIELIMGNRSIEVIGTRGTKDPFFSRAHGTQKPLSEIDTGDVLKASITNAQGNGISAILGVRNLTWEELEAAGIHKDKTSKVEYAKAEMSDEAKDLRKKLGDMLLEMAFGDKEEAKDLLLKFTSFTSKDGKEVKGKSSLADISEKAMKVTYGKVKEEYEKWQKKLAQLEESQEKAGEDNASGKLFEQ